MSPPEPDKLDRTVAPQSAAELGAEYASGAGESAAADAHAADVVPIHPGLDRPLTRPKDFERFAGFEARIELSAAVDGQKRFKGILRGLDGDAVKLETLQGDVSLALSDIEKAKLILTDALIAAAQAQQAETHA